MNIMFWVEGKEIEEEKKTHKQAGERGKKQRHPCFGQHFCYPQGAKEKRDPGALGK